MCQPLGLVDFLYDGNMIAAFLSFTIIYYMILEGENSFVYQNFHEKS